MVYVIQSSWPLDKTMDVVKIASELGPIPEYIKRKMLSNPEVGVGITCFDIYEFDNSKYQEAIEYLKSRVSAYYSVPGFSYRMNRWNDESEAMEFAMKHIFKK